ncbi:MAG: hypothetical protein AAGA54_22585 [Myxococcota bacterium]
MAVLGLLGPLVTGLACESEPAPEAEKPAAATADAASDPAAASAPKDDDHYTRRMEIWRDRVTEDPTLAQTARFFEAKTELSEISNNAKDVHLRANAALLLGLLYEGRGDRAGAIGQYEHATKLVKDDAGPYMALALALAAEKRYPEAAAAQKTATALDPDNLENWLVLGEVLVKSGDQKAGIAAYVDYEKRRKGLIDGLTLKNKQGDYLIGVQERVGCAEALASATDQGTAIALTYAFKSDPSADVRAAVASVMGLQRLTVYKAALQAALPTVKDPGVKESVAWAMAEIDRSPVEPKRPELPPEVAEAAGAAKAPEAAPAEAKAE